LPWAAESRTFGAYLNAIAPSELSASGFVKLLLFQCIKTIEIKQLTAFLNPRIRSRKMRFRSVIMGFFEILAFHLMGENRVFEKAA